MKQSMFRVSFLFVFMCFCLNSYAQLDTAHYLPPMHSKNSQQVMDHYIYLSTPTITPFTVTIKDGGGNIIATPTISNSSPYIFDIGYGSFTNVMVPIDSLNRALNTRGYILTAPVPFYANFRARVTNHAASFTTKGKSALGTTFRFGAIPTESSTSPNMLADRNFFLGMMATENNTTISISNYNNQVVFADPISDIYDDILTITLQKGQTYVISCYHSITANQNGLMGALVQSDKPIVCNVGNWCGGFAPAYNDIAAEQITPVEKLGYDYVVVAGKGQAIHERPIVVAHYNNTQVFTNNSTVPEATLNAGEYYVIPNDRYIFGNHYNMYIRTSLPAYVFQSFAGSNNLATMGFMYIPPANCNLPNSVDMIPQIEYIGSTMFTGDVFIVTLAGASVYLNGQLLSGGQSVLGFNWVTYKVLNQTGDVNVYSSMPATIGFIGASGYAGYGSYYSGFFENTSEPPPAIIDVCLNGNLNLTTSGGISYTWSGPNGFSSNQQSPVIENVTPVNAGQYNVTVTYPNACYDVYSTNVNILIPNASITTTTLAYCQNSPPVQFTAQQTGGIWSGTGMTSSGIFTPNSAGQGSHQIIYTLSGNCSDADTVEVTVYQNPNVSLGPDIHACNGDTITLDANPGAVGYTFLWSTGEQTQTIQVSQSNTYSVTVSNAGNCSSTSSVNVSFSEILDATITTTQTEFCLGDTTLQFTSINSGGTWSGNGISSEGLFNPNAAGSGISLIVYTIPGYCGGSDTLSVTVSPIPELSITGNTSYCAGDTIELTAVTPVNPVPTFLWSTGFTGQTLILPAQSSEQYSVTVSNQTPCSNSASMSIIVNPLPESGFSVEPNSGCSPLNVGFTPLNSGSMLNTLWTFGDGTTEQGGMVTHTYQQQGTFSVHYSVTDSNNCTNTSVQEAIINVYPSPVAEFFANPEIGKTYSPMITFNSTLIADSWLWDFGDGTQSNQLPPAQHTYPAEEATYQVILIVSNQFGCSDTTSKSVEIINDILTFTNIITPNGDGKNDIFVIQNCEKFPENSLSVFNRWGKKVFEAVNYQNNWSPTELSDGTYYYIFTYNSKQYTSSLTVIKN